MKCKQKKLSLIGVIKSIHKEDYFEDKDKEKVEEIKDLFKYKTKKINEKFEQMTLLQFFNKKDIK